jgi:hypothetical protein
LVAAPRALLFLTVPWSSYERNARLAFQAAAEQLAAEYPSLGVECFALAEDAEWCQAWLAGLSVPQLGSGYPLGVGSMVWLEGGRAVASKVDGCSLGSADIVSRSLSLWAGRA